MPLKDDDFAKVGKPEAYTKIIEELQSQEEKQPEMNYDFTLEEEDEK
ncbi:MULTISPECIES: hypothetical protein [Coprobacillaceae]|mgnify:CR=1 FL=1|nr:MULTISPECIES: hypothetical protein [Coprobacillaceae]